MFKMLDPLFAVVGLNLGFRSDLLPLPKFGRFL